MAHQVGVGERFWSMTQWEFQCALDGYKKESERQQELFAWHACLTANVWIAKKSDRYTVDKLMGRRKRSGFDSEQEIIAEMRRRLGEDGR